MRGQRGRATQLCKPFKTSHASPTRDDSPAARKVEIEVWNIDAVGESLLEGFARERLRGWCCGGAVGVEEAGDDGIEPDTRLCVIDLGHGDVSGRVAQLVLQTRDAISVQFEPKHIFMANEYEAASRQHRCERSIRESRELDARRCLAQREFCFELRDAHFIERPVESKSDPLVQRRIRSRKNCRAFSQVSDQHFAAQRALRHGLRHIDDEPAFGAFDAASEREMWMKHQITLTRESAWRPLVHAGESSDEPKTDETGHGARVGSALACITTKIREERATPTLAIGQVSVPARAEFEARWL